MPLFLVIFSIDGETVLEYDRLDAELANRRAAQDAHEAHAEHLKQVAEQQRLALKKAQENGFDLQNSPAPNEPTVPTVNQNEKPPHSN